MTNGENCGSIYRTKNYFAADIKIAKKRYYKSFKTREEADAFLHGIISMNKGVCGELNAKNHTQAFPKLTAEVFNRPDCPQWAKWAAADATGCLYRLSA